MKTLLTLLCLSFLIPCLAQTPPSNPSEDEQSKKEEQRIEKDMGARWIYNPKILPVIPISHKQFNANDEQIEVINLNNASVGMRVEKYKPNDNIGYGADLDIGTRNFIYQLDRDFIFNETYVNLTPFFTFKKGGLEKIMHYFINAGFVNNFVFNANAKYLTDQAFLNTSDNLSIFKRYRLFGYFEFGFKKDVFYSTWNKVKRSSHYTLSVGVLLPFFNQSSTFRNNNGDFINEFEPFKKNRSSYSGIVLNYTQNIDFRMNQAPEPYEDQMVDFYGTSENDKVDKDFQLTNKNHIFRPPLINFYDPETFLFG